jgi:hypothetical protein
MWIRIPDASGDITSASGFFWHHSTTAPNNRLALLPQAGTPDTVFSTVSQDGTAIGGTRFAYWGDANWVWLEFAFDPLLILGGSSFVDKLKFFVNFTLQTATIPPVPDFTSIHDSTALLGICCRISTGNPNVDTVDFASAYYTPGIPSLAGRRAAAGYLAPVTGATHPLLLAA